VLPRLTSLSASAYTVPTDGSDPDGTFAWDSTTMVVVAARAGGRTRIGYSYTTAAAAALINDTVAGAVVGVPAGEFGAAWRAMAGAVRNVGRPGLDATAVSAVDTALWDLKTRLFELPLTALLPGYRAAVPVYGSGGVASSSLPRLERQLAGWLADRMAQVKMKGGREPDRDEARARAPRAAIGDAELFVDANVAWTRKRAPVWAEKLAGYGVTWLKESVTSEDVDGLRVLRDRAPAGMDIAAGSAATTSSTPTECSTPGGHCLQAVTRRGGITGFLAAAAQCNAATLDVSAHTATSMGAHACTGVWHLRHLEYFRDHVRLEHMLFDGALAAHSGGLPRTSLVAGSGWSQGQRLRTVPCCVTGPYGANLRRAGPGAPGAGDGRESRRRPQAVTLRTAPMSSHTTVQAWSSRPVPPLPTPSPSPKEFS
jgi:L-alanine-DL-glutamate epimerase-like enolase superfamily enzyme